MQVPMIVFPACIAVIHAPDHLFCMKQDPGVIFPQNAHYFTREIQFIFYLIFSVYFNTAGILRDLAISLFLPCYRKKLT